MENDVPVLGGAVSGFADQEVDEVIAWLRSQGMRWGHSDQMDPGGMKRVLDRFC